MTPEPAPEQNLTPGHAITPELRTQLRALSHDLANSLETIMQVGYLLSQGDLDETSKKWVSLIDTAIRHSAKINKEIRDILRAQGT